MDGLAKGSKHSQNDSPEHASRVQQKAKEMVEFLEEEFEKKSSHLKALTSKGSVMETISFRSEETESGTVSFVHMYQVNINISVVIFKQ